MTHNLKQLRDHIVLLEVIDARHVRMDAAGYLLAARAARQIVRRELGILTMQAFVSEALPTLQTTAENIHFDSHRRFADLDGSGQAECAQATADSLMWRLAHR